MGGKRMLLWRAVDDESERRDGLVQRRLISRPAHGRFRALAETVRSAAVD